MSVVTIEKAGEHDGQEVTLRGWLYNLRESGKLLFPIFRDGTGLMQGVVSQKEQPAAFTSLRGLPQHSTAPATARPRPDPPPPSGYETPLTRVPPPHPPSQSAPYPIPLSTP